MPDSLIYVPESNNEKVKKILGERVVLALEIALDSSKEYIKKRYERDDEPGTDMFLTVFKQVFAAL